MQPAAGRYRLIGSTFCFGSTLCLSWDGVLAGTLHNSQSYPLAVSDSGRTISCNHQTSCSPSAPAHAPTCATVCCWCRHDCAASASAAAECRLRQLLPVAVSVLHPGPGWMGPTNRRARDSHRHFQARWVAQLVSGTAQSLWHAMHVWCSLLVSAALPLRQLQPVLNWPGRHAPCSKVDLTTN